MTQVFLLISIVSAILVIIERRIARIIIYLAVYSLAVAICYMLLGAPDVAMAEAVASIFITIFFIVCFEKYFSFADEQLGESLRKIPVLPLLFSVGLFAVFLYFRPTGEVNTYLKDLYLLNFIDNVGGENPVTAIYLIYRVYDTLFEALVVVISVVAAIHLSAHNLETGKTETLREVQDNGLAVYAIQIICPLLLLFGIYLVLNGHLSPGGGFQGGLAIASFFICRYMIYNINDLSIHKLARMEEIIFVAITLFAVSVVFLGGVFLLLPEHLLAPFRIGYMLVMNILIALKVACGFIILFYRYIVVENDEV
ncbi:MAG: DUF4040 domain-containing protein [Turicibacter sp.]|nr:DUF4040 domain-containing protein [Turicibacter sp.]